VNLNLNRTQNNSQNVPQQNSHLNNTINSFNPLHDLDFASFSGQRPQTNNNGQQNAQQAQENVPSQIP
jgi:hypothetical protein